jgi:dienelactone hydrolase
MWYPAETGGSKPFAYREYFTVPPLPRYPRFASRLEQFLLDTLSEDLFRKKRSKLSSREGKFLEVLLSTPTRAHRNAAPGEGRFPVLLYHTGAAGSFEDNSVMCEYLASHGYVVITSAFPSADGRHESNNYGGPETSWNDLSFLLEHARDLAFADVSNVGAIGHSMGAQYLLEWLGQPRSTLRAMVSLDTTLEYTPENYSGHRSLRKRLASLRPLEVPVLVAASAERHPNFATWNRYLPSRTDASIGYFRHGDFLLHGSQARAFSGEQASDVRRNYGRLVRVVGAFFDANLRKAPADWERLLAESSEDFRLTARSRDGL